MKSFFGIKNFKSHKVVVEFFLSFRSFKSREKVTEAFFSGHASYIFSVSSHWISLTIITF